MAHGVVILTMDAQSAYTNLMEYDQHQYRRNLQAQVKADTAELVAQGRWPPPWVNEDFAIQHDEGKLLSAIADQAGLPWRDDSRAVCAAVAHVLGMSAIGNAKATVKRCINLGYVRARYDRESAVIMLDLTDLGAAMLELYEYEQS